jgi:exopolysaccharide production protein ExoQ
MGLYLSPGNVSWVAEAVWVYIYLPGFLYSLRSPGAVSKGLLREPLILLLLLFPIISTQWSLAPDLTLRRGILLLALFHYSTYLSVRYTWKEICSLTRLALRLGILLSWGVCIFNPGLGVHVGFHEGLWKGLFMQKNNFGRKAAMLICMVLAQSGSGLSRFGALALFDVLLGIFTLYLCGSRTSLALVVGIAAVLAYLISLEKIANALRLYLTGAVLAVGILLSPVLFSLAEMSASANWDKLLTGRVSLWKTVLYLVAQRPWTGYGYAAFFLDETFGRLVLLLEGWPAPHSHNVAIQLAAELGVIAPPIYLLIMMRYHFKSLKLKRRLWILPLTIGLFNFVGGLSETGCFPDNSINSVLFIIMALTLKRVTLQQQTNRTALPCVAIAQPKRSEDQTAIELPGPSETVD